MNEELKHVLEAMREDNAATRKENAAKHEETRRHFDVSVERIETRSDAKHEETRRHFDVTVARIEARVDATNEETRRHFDVTAERLETRFELLAETVQHVNEELQRTRVSLTEKIEQSAAETQAMIKFSHKELDRRVTSLEEGQRALEETVADLQTRVQRIESGTH